MNELTRCSGGLHLDLSGELRGSIKELYEGKRIVGEQFKFESVGQFLQLLPERDRLEGYTLYIGCIENGAGKPPIPRDIFNIVKITPYGDTSFDFIRSILGTSRSQKKGLKMTGSWSVGDIAAFEIASNMVTVRYDINGNETTVTGIEVHVENFKRVKPVLSLNFDTYWNKEACYLSYYSNEYQWFPFLKSHQVCGLIIRSDVVFGETSLSALLPGKMCPNVEESSETGEYYCQWGGEIGGKETELFKRIDLATISTSSQVRLHDLFDIRRQIERTKNKTYEQNNPQLMQFLRENGMFDMDLPEQFFKINGMISNEMQEFIIVGFLLSKDLIYGKLE
jgi:hypothetical protein